MYDFDDELHPAVLKLLSSITEDLTLQPEGFAYRGIQWVSCYRVGRVKDQTIYTDEIAPLKRMIAFFGDMPISEITVSHVQQYFNKWRTTLVTSTQKRHLHLLNNIFEIGIEDGLCVKNPAKSKRLMISSTKEPMEKKAWTKEQAQLAWQFARTHPFGTDIQVLLETGISRSELMGLTWKSFDIENKTLTITDGLTVGCNFTNGLTNELKHDGVKNKYRRRIIPISDELVLRLKQKPRCIRVHKNWVTTRHIIYSPTGGAYTPDNWYKRQYKTFMNDFCNMYPEVPWLTPHELRHTRASVLVNDGINLYAVAQLLGHSDLKMLRQRYVHPDIKRLRTALSACNF